MAHHARRGRSLRESCEREAWRAARRQTRWWRILVIGALVTGPCALCEASSALTLSSSSHASVASISPVSLPGRMIAEHALISWLDSSLSPCPNGYENMQWVTALHESPTQVVHVFQFTTNGVVRQASVLIKDQNGVITPVGYPSLLSVAGSVSSRSMESVPVPADHRVLSVSSSVREAVMEWASAWLGTNNAALTVLVADPNPTHEYQAQDLGTLSSVTIPWLVTQQTSSSHGSSGSDPLYGIASVTLTFVPYHAPVKTDISSITVDVLIMHPLRGNPHVVDWQMNGAWRSLHAWSHATCATNLLTFSPVPSASATSHEW